MKKYLLSTLAVAGLFACTSVAQAAESTLPGPYVLGEAGIGIGAGKNKQSGIFGLGAGYHVNSFMRADMTVGYRPWGKVDFNSADSKNAKMWSLPVMANVYAKYPIGHSVDIYGMGGIGMAWNKTDDIHNASGKTKFNFAWAVGAGFDYYLNRCWSFDLGYRFTDLGKAKVRGNNEYLGKSQQSIRANDIKLTARYYF